MTTLTQTTEIVNFRNQPLVTVKIDEVIYTALRPIVEGMGLDWGTQQQKLRKNSEKFNCRDIPTVAQDGKIREMLCMPIKKLNGWLFSINPEKVKAEIRDIVIAYQEECFEALYNYWHNGIAVNPRRVTISVEQQKAIRSAVAKRCQSNSVHYQTVYTALYEHFNIPRYTELLADDFNEALRFIRNVELTPAIEQPVMDYGQQNAFWKLVGILQYEEVSKTITLMEALIKQGVVQMEALKKQKALIWDSLAEQKHPIYDPVIRDGLLKQAQDFIARQNALKFA